MLRIFISPFFICIIRTFKGITKFGVCFFVGLVFFGGGGGGFAVGSDVRFGFCSCFVLFVSTSTEVSVEEKMF